MSNPDYPRMDWTPERIQRFWQHQSIFGTAQHFGKMVPKALIRTVAPYFPKDPLILDYGCGTAYLTEGLLQSGYRVFGYDSSHQAITMAQERIGPHPRLAGLSSSAIPDQSFDIVFSSEVIEHLSDSNLNAMMQVVKKQLTPQGLLILTTPNNEDLRGSEHYCPSCNQVFHSMQHLRSWTAQTLTSYLEQQGFQVEKMIALDLTARYSWRPWVRVRYWLGRVPPVNLIALVRLAAR